MVASTIISRQILACLSLILLSHYCDGSKSEQLEIISANLQRIENLLVHQVQKENLNCIIPINVLRNLITEILPHQHQTLSDEENNEARRFLNHHNEEEELLKLLGLGDVSSKALNPLRKQTNHNENINNNINTNTNINSNQAQARRTLDKNLRSSQSHNQNTNQNTNQNFNINTNSNRYKNIFDLSDLSDEDRN